MSILTIFKAEHSGDTPLLIEAPEISFDEESARRQRLMQDKLEWAKVLLGSRYVLHPSRRITRENAPVPFMLEKSK
jgi:hypothetical protein